MIITTQQTLVLFDIAKQAMKNKGGFAGYSSEEIMKLLNNIIAQQDNNKNITVSDIIEEDDDIKENKEKNKIIEEHPTDEIDINTKDDFWEE